MEGNKLRIKALMARRPKCRQGRPADSWRDQRSRRANGFVVAWQCGVCLHHGERIDRPAPCKTGHGVLVLVSLTPASRTG